MSENFQTKIMNVAEVADLLEECEVSERQNLGSFDALRVMHPELGEVMLISSCGERHLLIHV